MSFNLLFDNLKIVSRLEYNYFLAKILTMSDITVVFTVNQWLTIFYCHIHSTATTWIIQDLHRLIWKPRQI